MASWDEVVKDYETKIATFEAKEASYLHMVALAHKVIIITNVIALIVGIIVGVTL